MAETWRQCLPKCRSKVHAAWLMSVLTKTQLDAECIVFLSKCYNAGLIYDELGRTVLHIAAACGRRRVLTWLCTTFRVNVNAKDFCSGWTPLHYAIHHGKIDSAINLLLNGADLYMKDCNCQTPLDLLRADVRDYMMISDDADVFTWGNNASYTLGQPNGQSKSNPEYLPIWSGEIGNSEQPRRLMAVSDVIMTKYTSFYLTRTGKVYACGSGRGGRLGIGSEQTVLPPTLIQSISNKTVISVSGNVNHAAFITSDGQLFVTGSNEFHQLGLGSNCSKELTPKLVRFKRETKFKLVACGRFHTIVMTDRELYACGLNAGQLGLLKDTPYQSEFKLVSSINVAAKDSQGGAFLALLTCSDSASVVKTISGDVFALTSYSCKKITSNCPSISQIAATGGHLDHAAASDVLKAEKATDLTIFMLVGDSGQVLIWRENSQSNQGGILRELRCTGLGRDLHASWIWAPTAANDGRILMCTKDGNAFIVTLAPFSNANKEKSKTSKSEWSAFHVADGGRGKQFRVNSYELASSTVRIKHVHRAVRIVADQSLNNFACIQSRPDTSVAELPLMSQSDLVTDMQKLFDQSSSPYDSSIDVELVFGSKTCLYAHRAILASMSSYFQRYFLNSNANNDVNPVTKRLRININDCEDSEFKPLLKFMYTGLVDLKNYLVQDDLPSKPVTSTQTPSPNKSKKSSAKNQKKNSPKSNSPIVNDASPKSSISEMALVNAQMLGRLGELCKRFGIGGSVLCGELDTLRTSALSGRAYTTSFKSSAKVTLERDSLDDFADVWLRSTDGREYQAHRCVLSCRSDYFGSMLAVGRWAEAGRAVITQPVEGDVLNLALTYIYSDWLGEVTDWKLLCKLVVYADQIFLNGLKAVAEVQLSTAPRLNLANCCQLLDFAYAYRAEILLPATIRFAIANMPSLFETHFNSLSSIEDEALAELASSFSKLACPKERAIQPWDSMAPSHEELEDILEEAASLNLTVDDDEVDVLIRQLSEMLSEGKHDNSLPKQDAATVPGNHNVRFGGNRNRNRPRRRSNNSESSDGGNGVPIFITTNPQNPPLSPSTHSPAIRINNGPMSPSFSNRQPNDSNSKKLSSWSQDHHNLSGGASNSSAENVSLADIMADEQRQQDSDRFKKPSRPRPIVQISSLSSGVVNSPPKSYNCPLHILASSPSTTVKVAPPSPSTTFRGWGSIPSSPVPHSPVPNMADILRQEQQRTDATRRQDRRSLQQIQLEERAIAEITKLYADLETHGVAVTVERMSVGVSAPTWVARSAPVVNQVNHFPALSSVR